MPRYMKKQTIEELKSFIHELIRKNDMEDLDWEGNPVPLETNLMYLVLSTDEFKGMSKIEADLYGQLSIENADFPTEEELASTEPAPEHFYYLNVSWAGFHTIEGRTFYGGFVSSDWTEPSFVAFYQDNKGFLRGYMPKKGNGFNPLAKTSFREDPDADDKYAQSKGFRDFKEMEEKNPGYIAELYDSELIKEDILNRLFVKD